MAIAPTGAIYKALIFDGESSRNYGVYITGGAVYNAPERDVEMISIPGRSGQFPLDNRRFENIEVTYPAGIFADNETNFAEAVSDVRNFLCSRRGYVRLTDEYNPNEYRMAVYKSGLEVSPAQLKAGEFEITFDCMPQRWLTSGEDEITAVDGGTLTNPTMFESCPLFEVEGYGTIQLDTGAVTLDNVTEGDVKIASGRTAWSIQLDSSLYEAGDEIYGAVSGTYRILSETSVKLSAISGHGIEGSTIYTYSNGKPDVTFIAGTANTVATWNETETDYVYQLSSPSTRYQFTLTTSVVIAYDGEDTITVTCNASLSGTGASYLSFSKSNTFLDIYTDSLIGGLGNPTYIDLEIGEAYKYYNGGLIPLNSIVHMPAKLPTLLSGDNTISFDGTITSLKVIPRWWKV